MARRRLRVLAVIAVFATACGTSATSVREPAQRVDDTAVTVTTAPSTSAAPDSGNDSAPTTSEAALTGNAAGSDIGVTREDPVAMGSLAPIGDWLVAVTGVVPDGSAIVAAGSEFNDPAPSGQQYVVIDIVASYVGGTSGSFWIDATWSAVGESAVAYDTFDASCGSIEGDPSYFGEVWPGGTVEGRLCFAVVTTDVEDLQLILDEGFGGEGRRFFALQEGLGTVSGIEQPETPALNHSGPTGTRGNPVALGTFAELGEWYVRVDAVNPDAADVVANAGFFGEPLEPGSQYFLAEVTQAYYGDEPGASAGSVQFQLLGGSNVAIDSWNASCGFLETDVSSAGELYAGGVVTGTVCFQVPADEVADVVLFADAFEFSFERAFLAVNDGMGTDPRTTLPAVPDVEPGSQGTWTNPFEVDGTVDVGDWQIHVLGVERDATATVLAESDFNEPPREGYQHVLVTLEATYDGSASGSFWSDLSWGLLGSGRVEYSEFTASCGSIPDDISQVPEVFAGGVISGTVCLTIPSAHADTLVFVLEDFVSFDDKVYVALD
ncbi:MAG: hypothetical protein OEM97_02330 [Acidimicrobiia bacterium]|nr:hypothetical protein [Acidimicrobiia bacterium]